MIASPKGTHEAARVLSRYGHANDELGKRTVAYLIADAHETGGWRCDFAKFGRDPETRVADAGATLFALDVLRFFAGCRKGVPAVERAVESLLARAHLPARR